MQTMQHSVVGSHAAGLEYTSSIMIATPFLPPQGLVALGRTPTPKSTYFRSLHVREQHATQ